MKRLLGKSPTGLFATQTVTGHLIRGAVAFSLVCLAINLQHHNPFVAMAAGLLALLAMRGCPVCWTIGLLETVKQRLLPARGAAEITPDSVTSAATEAPNAPGSA